jgi:hypothetical protein
LPESGLGLLHTKLVVGGLDLRDQITLFDGAREIDRDRGQSPRDLRG